MSPSGVEADGEVEHGPGLTADESPWRGAWGTTRPPRAGLEARRPACGAPTKVDLIGSGGAKSRVRPVAVVPGDVERQFLLHGGETVRNSDKSPGAFVLDGADAAFDHGEAAILADGAEPLPDTATATPALELPGGRLAALVRDKVLGLMAPEQALQKPSHKSRGG